VNCLGRRGDGVGVKAAVLLALAWCAVGVASEEDAFVPYERDQLKKMKGKELQALLWERGQECVGCAEKEDFVERVLEVQDMPVIQKRGVDGQAGGDENLNTNPHTEELLAGDGSAANVEEILAKMRNSGFGAKVFTKEDMAKMKDNPDEYAKMFGDVEL